MRSVQELQAAEATNELLQSGRFDSYFKDAVSYQEMNGLLAALAAKRTHRSRP